MNNSGAGFRLNDYDYVTQEMRDNRSERNMELEPLHMKPLQIKTSSDRFLGSDAVGTSGTLLGNTVIGNVDDMIDVVVRKRNNEKRRRLQEAESRAPNRFAANPVTKRVENARLREIARNRMREAERNHALEAADFKQRVIDIIRQKEREEMERSRVSVANSKVASETQYTELVAELVQEEQKTSNTTAKCSRYAVDDDFKIPSGTAIFKEEPIRDEPLDLSMPKKR